MVCSRLRVRETCLSGHILLHCCELQDLRVWVSRSPLPCGAEVERIGLHRGTNAPCGGGRALCFRDPAPEVGRPAPVARARARQALTDPTSAAHRRARSQSPKIVARRGQLPRGAAGAYPRAATAADRSNLLRAPDETACRGSNARRRVGPTCRHAHRAGRPPRGRARVQARSSPSTIE